jgi:hypothetical protein
VPKKKSVVLVGRSVSGGIAVGRAEIHHEDPSVVPTFQLTGPEEIEAELRLFSQALDAADREAQADVVWARGNSRERGGDLEDSARSSRTPSSWRGGRRPATTA